MVPSGMVQKSRHQHGFLLNKTHSLSSIFTNWGTGVLRAICSHWHKRLARPLKPQACQTSMVSR
jgi:hypothetical protein